LIAIMKKLAAAAIALFTIAAVAQAEDTERYLIATRQPFHAGAVERVLSDEGLPQRNVDGFESFNGFAADLTKTELYQVSRNANVRWIEPELERHAYAQAPRNLHGQTIPYGIDMIHAREAAVAQHNATTNVVVIDTGVDYTHPELRAIYAGGYNFIAKTDDPLDDGSHGTHVAGTIAAANNSIGVVGVAPDVRLWALKVLNSSGSGSNSNIIKAFDWIIAKKKERGGNWIANLSLGASDPSNAEREAVNRAISAGILIVAASGNESTSTVAAPVGYPAAYDGVIAVGAIDDAESLATFSNQGPELDVVAPGVDVLSTLPVGTGSIAWLESGASTYAAAALTGAKRGTITGAYVYCGLGKPEEIPASVAGKIALIKRGELTFADKAKNAKLAGAIAVAIFNNDLSAMNWTLLGSTDPVANTYDWPVTIGISKADGDLLAARNSGTITVANEADDYGVYSGTSMASPHVAGAAAFLWSAAPAATANDIAAALTQTATDLGLPGFDTGYGWGIVNVLAGVQRLAPSSIPPVNGKRRRSVR